VKNVIGFTYHNVDNGRSWRITFQAEPPTISLMGDDPDPEEVVDVLMQMHAPIYLVPILLASAGFARKAQFPIQPSPGGIQ